MITEAVLNWLFGLVDWAISGVPTTEVPVTLSLSWLTDINYFIPVSEMFSLFMALFLLGGPFLATSLIVWLVVGVLRGGSPKA